MGEARQLRELGYFFFHGHLPEQVFGVWVGLSQECWGRELE